MILQLRVALFSAFIGLFVGFFWEGYGAFYLWTLAFPKLIFGLAMIAWSMIGVAMALILRCIETISPRCKIFLKPLVGPLALIIAKMTNVVGIISFPSTKPLIFGVPLYMMIGLLVLVYLLDDLLSLLRKQ